jgi:hypothetical protein
LIAGVRRMSQSRGRVKGAEAEVLRPAASIAYDEAA